MAKHLSWRLDIVRWVSGHPRLYLPLIRSINGAVIGLPIMLFPHTFHLAVSGTSRVLLGHPIGALLIALMNGIPVDNHNTTHAITDLFLFTKSLLREIGDLPKDSDSKQDFPISRDCR